MNKFSKFLAILAIGTLNIATFDMAAGMLPLTPNQRNWLNDHAARVTAEINNTAPVDANRAATAARILAWVMGHTGVHINFGDGTSVLGVLEDFLLMELGQAGSGAGIKNCMVDHIRALINGGNNNLQQLLDDINAL